MFINKQDDASKLKYAQLLKAIGALSKLSSDADNIPYLYYRIAENIFCRAFNARNLSRSDVSIDAEKDSIGVGLKTFLHKNGRPFEKIAEFNKERVLFSAFENDTDKLISKISTMRNKRISLTASAYDIEEENLIYHCVTRSENKFNIYETPMKAININTIKNIKRKNNSISFNDNVYDYSFNISKSTLFQRFEISPICKIDAEILEDPFDLIEKLLESLYQEEAQQIAQNKFMGQIYLPLYSPATNQVQEKSGLNQWNADGRDRRENEVYIPIPIWIHRKFPNFFPPRDVSFNLHLPNKGTLSASLCQDSSKALMTNPNKALGEWILRDVLRLKPGTLLTYEILQEIGIDSIEIIKETEDDFHINFKEIGTYKEFEEYNK